MVSVWRRRNLLIFAAAAALVLTLIPIRAFAQEATVSATVTPGFVTVSISPTTVAYGIVNLGSTNVLPTPGTFTATNDGTVTADFLIRGADTTGWILSGAAGADAYVHRASSDGFVAQTIVLSTTNQSLKASIAAAGTSSVSLNMDVPTSSTPIVEQTAAVTIVATVAP